MDTSFQSPNSSADFSGNKLPSRIYRLTIGSQDRFEVVPVTRPRWRGPITHGDRAEQAAQEIVPWNAPVARETRKKGNGFQPLFKNMYKLRGRASGERC
jgi:hypothetical protein